MAYKLSDALNTGRIITLTGGLVMHFRSFQFAEYVEIEAASRRQAKDRLQDMNDLVSDLIRNEVPSEEYFDKVEGIIAEVFLDTMVEKFCTSWNGIFDVQKPGATPEDDVLIPVEFSIAAWVRFRKAFPQVAMELLIRLKAPNAELVSEGNAFTP